MRSTRSRSGRLPARRPGTTGIASRIGRRLRARAGEAASWLTVDVGATIRVEPAAGAAQSSEPRSDFDLRRGLSGWRRRVARRRAVVLIRRHLLAGLVVAFVALAVIAIAGGDRRSIWLVVPVVAALALAAAGLTRSVRVEQTAALLDSGLALKNRVGTALELSRAPAAAGEARTALVARVEDEAATAVATSLNTARLRVPHASIEWSALLAVAAATALLVALPAARQDSASASALAGGGRGLAGGRSGVSRAGRSARGSAPTATPPIGVTASLPSRIGYEHDNNTINPYVPQITAEELRREGIAGAHNQGTQDFKTIHSNLPGGAAGQSGEGGTKPAGSGSAEALPSHTGTGGGGLGSPTKVPTGAKGLATSPGAGSSSKHGGAAGSSPGQAGAATSGSQGGAQGGKAPPGGDQAGTARGSALLGPGLAPDLSAGDVSLPLQAGYAPSTSKHTTKNEGTSQTANGGGGGGRSATSQGTASGGGTGFAVLPPTSDTAAAADQTQVSNYFGGANQLGLGSW